MEGHSHEGTYSGGVILDLDGTIIRTEIHAEGT